MRWRLSQSSARSVLLDEFEPPVGQSLLAQHVGQAEGARLAHGWELPLEAFDRGRALQLVGSPRLLAHGSATQHLVSADGCDHVIKSFGAVPLEIGDPDNRLL